MVTGSAGMEALQAVGARRPWVKRFIVVLRDASKAAESFNNLIDAGLDTKDLLNSLELACTADMASHAVRIQDVARDVSTFAARLKQSARQLKKFETLANEKVYFKMLLVPEFQGLSGRLDSLAKSLQNEANELSKTMTAREASTIPVAFLAGWVKGVTGSEHYGDLARLMEAYYSMIGKLKDVTPQAVKKRVQRFRKKHSYAYAHFESMARRQYGYPEKPKFVADGQGGLKYADRE
jgi:hypothetical protein